MNRTQKVTVAVSGVVVAGLVALAAPPVLAATSWASEQFTPVAAPAAAPASAPTATPAATPAAESDDLPADVPDGYVSVGDGTFVPAGGPGDCEATAWINFGRMNASLYGELVDQGPSGLASGTAGLDGEGRVVTYTVAAGDALYGISDRFCIGNPLAIENLNHTRMIHPGDVLLLRPDSSIPWVPYFSPDDAPAGYQQIPYQHAIQDMSAAAAAGDIAAMREIFDDRLSGMFPNAADAALIAEALDAGDLRALRQMFA